MGPLDASVGLMAVIAAVILIFGSSYLFNWPIDLRGPTGKH